MAPAQGELFKELQRQIGEEEYEKVVETCSKILATDADDADALHCKAVAQIQCAQYENALETMARSPEVAAKLRFEEIYCRYKLRQHEEALKALSSVAKGSEAEEAMAAHLRAQILYRTGDSTAVDVYRSLVAVSPSLNEADPQLLVNLVAAASFSKESSAAKEVQSIFAAGLHGSNYELAYNLACCMIRLGDAGRARSLLQTAIAFCTSSLQEEGYTQKELEEELAVLRLQLGYVNQILGGSAEALYQQVLEGDPSDAELKAVAVNNLASVQRDQKLFKAEKSLQHATSGALAHKLTGEQVQAFHMNRAIVLLKMNKLDQCKEVVAEIKSKYGQDCAVVSILEAFIAARDSSPASAIALLEKAPANLQVLLCLAQLHLNNGSDSGSALSALQRITGDDRFLPGIVGTVVALYQQMDKEDLATEALNEALAFWKKRKGSWEYLKLLQAAAKMNFAQKKFDLAVDCYRQLSEVDSGNKQRHLARLVVALSEVDPDAAEKYLSEIPNVVSSEGIDAAALEKQSAAATSKAVDAAAAGDQSTDGNAAAVAAAAGDGEAVERKRKTKKKKKKRLPKNYDPAVPPDPERWLARRDRSSFKKRRGNRAQRGGHQGGGLTRAQQKEQEKKLDQRSQAKEAQKDQPAPEPEAPVAARVKKGAKKAKKKGRRR
mmetsp:Transcript_15424/g.60279  ORF Transcript_15424/g.60279 Transcript_15424/m.60279 type:complete len:664 (+) Transcript_15424:24-2015(+)